MAYASATDVQDRLGRVLDTAETAQVTALLSDVEILIKARIPDLDDKVTDGDVLADVVIMVEANAVVRLMRNPDGFISETDGNYSYQKSGKLASGALELLDFEWSLLGVSSSMFLITMKVKTPWEELSAPAASSVDYAQWTTNDPMFWSPL